MDATLVAMLVALSVEKWAALKAPNSAALMVVDLVVSMVALMAALRAVEWVSRKAE